MELNVIDGKIYDSNGNFVCPEIGNPKHVALNKRRKQPTPKLELCIFCKYEFHKSDVRPFVKYNPYELNSTTGRIYDKVTLKTIVPEIGDPYVIELLHKKPTVYVCHKCARKPNVIQLESAPTK